MYSLQVGLNQKSPVSESKGKSKKDEVALELTEPQLEKYNLITRNLQEVLGADMIKKLIIADKPITLYWGESSHRTDYRSSASPDVSLFSVRHCDNRQA